MGEVYRGRDTKLGREVALKVLSPALANDAGYIARFQREAKALASLNHPNIAQIYGLEGNAIVMELVEAGRWRSESAPAPFRWMKLCLSPGRSPKPWKPRTKKGSSIGT
jgi:serine/threonine protein kinase